MMQKKPWLVWDWSNTICLHELNSAILEIQSIGIKFCNYKCKGTNYKDLKKTVIEITRDEEGYHNYHTVA